MCVTIIIKEKKAMHIRGSGGNVGGYGGTEEENDVCIVHVC